MAVNFIRAQRLGWLGHIKRMQETRMVKAIYSWKPISIRPIGRPRHAGRMMLEKMYTGCPRRKGPNFGRVFLRSNYTDITQNTYIQSSMVTEILAREV